MRDIDLQGQIRISFNDDLGTITISQRENDDAVRELFYVRAVVLTEHGQSPQIGFREDYKYDLE